MQAHDRVMALGTDKSCLLPVVRATVLVIADARGELDSRADALAVEVAVEIDPLTAVVGPWLAAEGLLDPGGEDFRLKLSQVFAGHGFGPTSRRLSRLSQA